VRVGFLRRRTVAETQDSCEKDGQEDSSNLQKLDLALVRGEPQMRSRTYDRETNDRAR
jgi:hypothetical protein